MNRQAFREAAGRVWADASRVLEGLKEMEPEMPEEDYSYPPRPETPKIKRLWPCASDPKGLG